MDRRSDAVHTPDSRGTTRRGLLIRAAGTAAALFASRLPWAAAAPTATVVVDLDEPLGPASRVFDFLGGELYLVVDETGEGGHYERTPEDPTVRAWRKVKFAQQQIGFLGSHVKVSRRPNGELRYDWRELDAHIEDTKALLGARRLHLWFNTPEVMSTRDSSRAPDTYPAEWWAPRNLNEYASYVTTVVDHVRSIHDVRPWWSSHIEPETIDPRNGHWYGSNPENPPDVRRDEHVDLHIATYDAVKRADRAALVGGPCTFTWDANTGLEGWLRALRCRAGGPKKLDFVTVQDYVWNRTPQYGVPEPALQGPEISKSAALVRAALSSTGYSQNLPIVLAGGLGGWCDDYAGVAGPAPYEIWPPAWQSASHIAYNVIRETRDPSTHNFAFALYYYFKCTWPLSTEPFNDVRMLDTPGPDNPDAPNWRYAPYAAFELLAAHADDRAEIVNAWAAPPLVALATGHGPASAVVTVNNHTDRVVYADVEVRGLNEVDAVRVRARSVDRNYVPNEDGLPPNPPSRPMAVRAGTLHIARARLGPFSTRQWLLDPV